MSFLLFFVGGDNDDTATFFFSKGALEFSGIQNK
jgi:hypothetical protein